jgi:hypothetical protein
MSCRIAVVFILCLTPSLSLAQAVYPLRVHDQKSGEVVRIHTKTDAPNGTMTSTRGAEETKAKMTLKRERILERRYTIEGATAKLEYRVVSDTTATGVEVGGVMESSNAASPLTGKSVFGFRDTYGRWRLFLEGATAGNAQAMELSQLEAYENRRVFIDQPVRVGQTWDIDPNFLRHLTERDVGHAEVKASARLDSIKEIDGEETAVITLNVQTVGTTDEPGGLAARGAAITASGELHVSLATMLDKKLVLYGSLTTGARNGLERTRVHLPFRTEVIKTITR